MVRQFYLLKASICERLQRYSDGLEVHGYYLIDKENVPTCGCVYGTLALLRGVREDDHEQFTNFGIPNFSWNIRAPIGWDFDEWE